MDALVVDKVRKTFEAENAPVRALRGANLVVPSGDFVALMGPSGCGKSTLLNLVAGLDVADEGTITVAGELVTGRTEDELSQLRRRHIGIVFQFFNLLEGMTVLENVALPAVIAGRKRKMAESRARDLLDLLGIGDKAGTVPGMLSGGQRQRLAIAARPGQRADVAAGRRADGCLGLRGRPGGHRAPEPPARRGADDRARHPRCRRRVGGRPDRAHARREDRRRGGLRHSRRRPVLAGTRPVTVGGEMKLEVAERPAVTAPAPAATAFGSFRLLQVLILGLTIAGVVVGLRISVPGGIAPVNAVAFGLTVAWALVGIRRHPCPGPHRLEGVPLPSPRGSGRLRGDVALTAGRQAETAHASAVARDVATIAAVAVTAISFHFLLALPDGRLHDSFRRTTVVIAYVAALGVGIGLILDHQPFTVVDGAISWAVAGVLAIAPMRARYIASIGYHRERMEWFGIGVTLAATVALVATVLHLLVGWPGPSVRSRRRRRCSSRSASWPARARGWGRTRAGGSSRSWRCSGSSSWSRPSTSSSCSASGTHRRRPVTRRSWPSPWSPPAWPRSSSSRCGSGSSSPPRGSSTGRGRRPTRSCGPSGAG